MSLTQTQQEAISATGNVLVAAGAGTGKTRTLVERCLACLLHEKAPASIDEILMVTFTEAAAAEMRQRIRAQLEEQRKKEPKASRWPEQLALFETAHIGTLHGFCYQLVRQHFYQLGLDPLVSVLAEEETRLLAEETLDDILQGHYAGAEPLDEAVRNLIQIQGRGWDKPIRSLVFQLHHYAQTLPDPSRWLKGQLEVFDVPTPVLWRRWLEQALADFPDNWIPKLEAVSSTNQVAASCGTILRKLAKAGSVDERRAFFEEITSLKCPPRKKKLWVDPFDNFFSEARFLSSLISTAREIDPLEQDWVWVRGQMTALLEFTREFSETFAEAKKELGVLDFHDLEQHSLKLLWDGDKPTAMANGWRNKLRYVLVDEYQDINAAQDRIIQALARLDDNPNRFLVGDVKQSIYGFRLASPRIFHGYAEKWQQGPGRVIHLVENFRAREGVLNFVNSVFKELITPELGGVDYATEATLQFGARQQRLPLSAKADPEPRVELHLLPAQRGPGMQDREDLPEELSEVAELLDSEKEARLVALQLTELRKKGQQIWDLHQEQFRPVDWGDMAILLRSPANKVESYAKEFAKLKVPLAVARSGFYNSMEILDLLSLLKVLDNPQQDVAIIAVLHSPLVGLNSSELAEIRLTAVKAPFWTALKRWHTKQPSEATQGSQEDLETRTKVSRFMEQFERWRRVARRASLSRCLELVLAETHYSSWLLAQPNGSHRSANVQRFIALAQRFDQFQRQGLFRFLKFIEAQQAAETEPEVPAIPIENAVRLMSIHQSKGLEFPVVVVADLGKRFNLANLRSEVILDEEYGLCPQIKPPHTGQRYPSLAHWLGSRRQLRELLGEELRLLYVAMTRARDTLVLTGSVSAKKISGVWGTTVQVTLEKRLAARSYADWLGLWSGLYIGGELQEGAVGQNGLVRWHIHEQSDLETPKPDPEPGTREETDPVAFESEAWQRVEQRLQWQYPYSAASEQPAKTSVSSLRRQVTLLDEEAALFGNAGSFSRQRLAATTEGGLSATDIGHAYHQFLQFVLLSQTGSAKQLRLEANRLCQEGRLSAEQAEVLDFEVLERFWVSELGRRIIAQANYVERELAFTVRFSPAELAPVLVQSPPVRLEDEFVLVQGVADLCVITPTEVWLVDFKTDKVETHEIAQRIQTYRPQLELYAMALSRIYRRPVSEKWLYFLNSGQAVHLGKQETGL